MARTSKYENSNTAFAHREIEWRAGLYIRLSREDGDKPESESISSQKALLERYVNEHTSLSLSDFYIDDGWSGTDFDRPDFQRMIADITNKKINCVIVKDLSRFGRNYVEAGKYLETVFPLFKVRFIAINDQIDSTANPLSMNNIIVPFKNIINDEYCRDISMKVRSALDTRRRQGKFIGSFAAYGYKKDETDHNKLVIDEEAAQTVRLIYRKFLDGYSILGISRELNALGIPNPSEYKRRKGLNCAKSCGLWTDSTVRRILTNELYIGNLIQKKNEVISHKIHKAKAVDARDRIEVKDAHEPIISKHDFEKVQSLLKRDTRTSPKTQKLSLFAGFIKCADCGRAMQKRTVKQPYKTYEYYVCSTYRKMHSSACTKHAIRADVLENTVLTALNDYIRMAVDFDRLFDKIKKTQRGVEKSQRLSSELASHRQELNKAEKILLDIYPDLKSGIISREQYLSLKERYEKRIESERAAISTLNEQIARYENGFDGSNEFIATFKKYRGLKELTRDIVVELIENIYVQESGAVEIHLKCKESFLSAKEFFEQQNKSVENSPEIKRA